MIKVSRSDINKINNKFPSLDRLFEREILAEKLGYYRIAVSCFDSWLSSEDYQLIEQVSENIVNNQRIKLFSDEVYQDLFLLGLNGECFYSLQSQNEIQLIIKNSILNQCEETLINIASGVVFEIGGENYTDIVTFKDLKELEKFRKRVLKVGLLYFRIE